jgi:hypothetical protein
MRTLAAQPVGVCRGRGIRRSPSSKGEGRYSLKTAGCRVSGGSLGGETQPVVYLTQMVSNTATDLTTQVIDMTNKVLRNEKTHKND